MSDKHTPEPWHIEENGYDEWTLEIRDANRTMIAAIGFLGTYSEPNTENARRIVACVNACAGISTETLEKMDFGELAKVWADFLY